MGILKRIIRTIIGAALVAASLAVLVVFPVLRLTGKGAESFLADAAFQVTDSLEFAEDELLHSRDFDRAAIEAAGVDLSEKNVVSLLGAVKAAAGSFTDGDLSLAELLRAAILTQCLLPTADRLDSTPAARGLFDTLGIESYYEDCKAGYAAWRRPAAGALIAFEALLGLLLLCALGSVLQALFGHRKGFDAALLVLELLLLGLLWGAAFLSRPLLGELGLPATAQLSPVFLSLLAPAGVILGMVFKTLLSDGRK